jgi:hypothetical protein
LRQWLFEELENISYRLRLDRMEISSRSEEPAKVISQRVALATSSKLSGGFRGVPDAPHGFMNKA